MESTELFEVIKKFDKEMNNLYKSQKRETGYYSEMNSYVLKDIGGYEAVKRLIHFKEDSEALKLFASKKRLDLAAESLVLKKDYEKLFTENEKEICRKRLEEYSKSSV
jgi:hypothetical protein